jgi:protein-S-isoprenylcysteine O-methyltransferase Ste14
MTRTIRSVAFVVVVAGTVGIAIPWGLVAWADGRLALGLGKARLVALAPTIAGVAVYLASAVHLTVRGNGIPAPVDPTRNLVVSGPYGLVRNPMYVAGSLFFCGLAVLADSGVLLLYALLALVVYYPVLVRLEERALRHRFGRAYDAYCARVPRWLPSLELQRHDG